MTDTDTLIQKAAEHLSAARNVVALTGAGISVESGIPPFRGKGGVWEKIDPMEYATIDAFERNPRKVWEVLISGMKEVIETSRPNPAHLGLAALEEMGKLSTVITQNVDGLHQAAGNADVIEFHGTFAWQRCVDCSEKLATAELQIDELPPRCPCGGIYRPEVIFFGEQIPMDALARSQLAASQCDVMLVVGTSAVVQPASYMPVIAKQNGAKIIEINPEKTPLSGPVSDYTIMGPAGDILTRILKAMPSVR